MFSKEEKSQVKRLLVESFQAASDFDGSEQSEQKLFEPLYLFDDFVRAHSDDALPISQLEQEISKVSFPKHPINMPTTIDGFLDIAAEFYDRLKNSDTTQSDSNVWMMLEEAGAIVKQSDQVFVKTDDGHIQEGRSNNPNSYKVSTEPRLAMLIAHLRNDGVNGQSIYMDDMVITQGRVDTNMMREHPYNIVQIPRLDMEVVVCDQIGETTFVKKGTVGSEFWDHLTKDQLKARDDVENINRHNDDQWWHEISEFLSGNAEPTARKVNVQAWKNRKPKLDIDLVKQSLLAHRLQTGEWLSNSKKLDDGAQGSYILQHGTYKGQLTVATLEGRLVKAVMGIPEKTSIAKLNEEISLEHNLDYKNMKKLDGLSVEKIKDSLLEHRLKTGEWLSRHKEGEDGMRGHFVLQYGEYANVEKIGVIESALRLGSRGLEKKSTVAKLNAEVSQENGLDYTNNMIKDDLNIDLIKSSLLEHRLETGEWLTQNKSDDDGLCGSYVLEYGYYAGQLKVGNLNRALHQGLLGLEGSTTIAKLNDEVSKEHSLDYVNKNDRADLDIELVKESLLAHYEATGEWLSKSKKAVDGKRGSYVLEHGVYAGEITAINLDNNLYLGHRGLSGGSSLFKFNEELRAEIENSALVGADIDEEDVDSHPSP